MKSAERVVSEASTAAVPGLDERRKTARVAKLALGRTKVAAGRYPEVREVVLGGSYAKGTWLPESVDIDIFVRIEASTPETRFEEVGLEVGKRAMEGYPRGKKYAQHPYTEASIGGVKVNIVPCYAVVKKQWQSAADRSPFHVELVRGLSQEKKTQIRLLKRFMKAVGVYGAEIETQGFSGYVAEVLVIREKSFIGVVRSFAELRVGEGRLFTLPDPVDPSRDLGIAVSGEKLATFVLACREFLSRPRPGFFKRMSGRPRQSMEPAVIAVVFSHGRLSEDILWGELRKTSRHLVRHVEGRGFKIARSMAASNNADRSAILLIPEFAVLPALEQRVGPRVDMKKEAREFIRRNSRKARLVWVDDDARLRLLQEREHTDLLDLLGDVASGKEGSVGASKEVAAGMAASAKVVSGRELSKLARSEEWVARGVRGITSDAIGTGGD